MKMIEMDKCTGYQWCLEANMRITDISKYRIPGIIEGIGSVETHYYIIEVTKTDFIKAIADCNIKPNSTPRKTERFLEYRMYGLVPYNISSIQGAIQYGHALQEYNNLIIDSRQKATIGREWIGFNKWRNEDKTFIILNGGTTNEDKTDKFYGTLQQSRDLLVENDIFFSQFREPDLNNSLTAVVFLVDERVWNRELYKKFEPETIPWSKSKPTEKQLSDLEVRNSNNYLAWEEKIGGPKNSFLREFLKDFRLAN